MTIVVQFLRFGPQLFLLVPPKSNAILFTQQTNVFGRLMAEINVANICILIHWIVKFFRL